jgi:signal transduction histidine kinase
VYREAPAGSGVLRRMIDPIMDPRRWLDALHGMLVLVVSAPTFVATVGGWGIALSLLLYPFYDWAVPLSEHDHFYAQLGLSNTAPVRIVTHFVPGLLLTIILPFVLRGGAYLQASLGRALLTDVPGLRQRITGLEVDKAVAEARTTAAVSAEAIALRRLERDIHDGPQQRLVRLAMDLGRAQLQLDSDPAAARQSVAEALSQTRETLDELRALSRGIAPPVLADRGLAAAIAALASRCTVPVDVVAPELGRLDPAVENTAYFVIAESLTNVAKHSAATECRVRLDRLGDRLLVTVSDDGVGGAHLAKGHGLTGLADRAHAVGGTLAVHSPDGGPTTISAELPWH